MNATPTVSTARTAASAAAATASTRPPRGGWKSANARLWLTQTVLAVGFLAAAAPKLGGDPRMVENFAALGISATGMHTIGFLEIAGAIGLLVPRLVGAAAAGLVALMIGAIALTVVHVGVQDAVAPVPFLAIAGVVAWFRRDRTADLTNVLVRAVRRQS
jgi:uncharacterized membrane protein YphA (DoxX/SURF4 family)